MPDRFLKPYLLVLSSLFAAASLGGFLLLSPVQARGLVELLALPTPAGDLSGGLLFLFILVSRTIKALLILLAGVVPGIVPVLAATVYGLLLGAGCRAAEAGSVKAALLAAPHEVFEIPAVLIAAAYGLWLGAGVLRRIRRHEDFAEVGYAVSHAVRRFFTLVFPLLLVAAAVETALVLGLPGSGAR